MTAHGGGPACLGGRIVVALLMGVALGAVGSVVLKGTPRSSAGRTMMERLLTRCWRLPDRVSPTGFGLSIGLAALMITVAALNLLLYDERHEVGISAILYGAIGWSHLAWRLGCRRPAQQGGDALRRVGLLLIILLVLAVLVRFVLAVAER